MCNCTERTLKVRKFVENMHKAFYWELNQYHFLVRPSRHQICQTINKTYPGLKNSKRLTLYVCNFLYWYKTSSTNTTNFLYNWLSNGRQSFRSLCRVLGAGHVQLKMTYQSTYQFKLYNIAKSWLIAAGFVLSSYLKYTLVF